MIDELVYRGLDRCDACGGTLAPSERLAGLCPACRHALASDKIRDAARPPHKVRRGRRQRSQKM